MVALNLQWFLQGVENEQIAKAQLEEYLRCSTVEYKLWRIFEHYKRIANLANVLHEISEQTTELRSLMPQAVIFNQQGNKLTLECAEKDATFDKLDALIKWSLPKLVEQIVFGDKVYDQVLSVMTLQPVGSLPQTRDTGYAFFFDYGAGYWHIYRFAKRHTLLANGRVVLAFQEITDDVCALDDDIPYRSPMDIKSILMSTHTDFLHPAAYKVEAEFAVPYAETMCPLAKQLLIKEVCA